MRIFEMQQYASIVLLILMMFPFSFWAHPSVLMHEIDDVEIFGGGNNPLLNSKAYSHEKITIWLSNGVIDENGVQHRWPAIINTGKKSKNTLYVILNGEIDQNAKTYFKREFGFDLTPDNHRIIGHTFFEKEPPQDIVRMIKELSGDTFSDNEIIQKLKRIDQRLLTESIDAVKEFSTRLNWNIKEKTARAYVKLHQGIHIWNDLLPDDNTRVRMLASSEELLDEMSRAVDDTGGSFWGRTKIKHRIRRLKKDVQRETQKLQKSPPALNEEELRSIRNMVSKKNPKRSASFIEQECVREQKRVIDDKIKQEVAKKYRSRLKDIGLLDEFYKDVAHPQRKKIKTSLAGSKINDVNFTRIPTKRYVLKSGMKWGGVALMDSAITFGMLWYEDAEAKEYLKQGTALAAATTAAWATESILVYAGMTTAFTSTSVVTVSGFLAPVPVVGPATLIAAGVYMGVRFGVCYAWDVHEQKEAERIERECQQIELQYVHGLREKMIEKNTQQLKELLEKE